MKLSNPAPWILASAFAFAPVVAGCSTNRSPHEQIDDSSITASVKSKLIADGDTEAHNIDVNTDGGVVYLIGKVDTQAEKEEAERIARSCSGVKKVVNHLTVKKT